MLRPYQKESIKLLKDSFKRGNKIVLLCLATGAGKSIIAREIVKMAKEKNNKVLFVAHRTILVKQMRETLKGLDNVTVGTTQSLSKLSHDVKLVIIDEAHFGNGSKMMNNLPNVITVGLSATPLTREGYKLDGWDEIIDLVQLSDLIDMGYAAPVKVFAPVKIDTKSMKTVAGDFATNDAFNEMTKSEIIGDILNVYEKHAKGLRTIVYCVNIEHAEMLNDLFFESGYRCNSVHSKKKDNALEQFKNGDIDILFNVDVLTTGLDMPDVYCLILATPTKSIIKAVQIYGRATRLNKDDNDKVALILDCANVIENTIHPLDRMDFTKKKEDKNIKKCSLCKHNMRLINRKTKPYDEMTYQVISEYKCIECENIEFVENFKVIEDSKQCEECGESLKGAPMITVEKDDELLFNQECTHCLHQNKFRSIKYTDEELKEISIAKNGIDYWIDLESYLKENRGTYHWKWVTHAIEEFKANNKNPKHLLEVAKKLIQSNKKIAAIKYA